MIDKATQDTRAREMPARPAKPRWTLPAALAFVFVVAIVAGVGGAPYLFQGATLESEIAEQVRATTGLALSSPSLGRFELLPRPRIAVDGLHVSDPTGTLSIDADALEGDVRLLPLIVGRIELSSATLTRPRLIINLDGAPMRADNLIGRAMRAATPISSDTEQRLGIVTLVDGSAIIRSKAFPRFPNVESINVTFDWRDLESPATLTGSVLIRKTSADIAAWIAQPSALMRGDHSAVAVHVHSAPIDLSANGDLVSSTTAGFRGHLSATAPSTPALLDLVGNDIALLAPFANLSLDSDASVAIDPQTRTSIDLPNLTLHADGNEYEGTLAFQTGPRPALSGTLASEQLMLAPFFNRMPNLVDPRRRWSAAPILGKAPQLLDLDLRISATHMRLAPFTIDDAALAVITHDDRTEVALVEGKAYGGIVKGRFSVGVTSESISLRGTGALTDADASTLTWDAFGRQIAVGTLSASVNVETDGDSPAALMQNLQGWAKGRATDGELSGIDIVSGLREAQHGRGEAAMNALHAGRTSFSAITFGGQIVNGIATIDRSTLESQNATVAIGGTADLAERSFDLHAVATPPSGTPPPADIAAARLAFDIRGSFDKPIVAPDPSKIQPAKKP